MRITGGMGRGRRLSVPAGDRVRPTSDKVKQALFNILGEQVRGARFLDLFAGAGGIGLEALSREASQVVFVDSARTSLLAIRQNIETLGFAGRAVVIASRSESFLKNPQGPYDIIFLDPPYRMELAPLLRSISDVDIVKPGGLVVAEHFKKQPSPEHAGRLERYREATYGDTALAFYRLGGVSEQTDVTKEESS